ncbi:MAG: 2-oxoacid:ferredoxin oxidoreductase subunit beta [Acidobacteria bacterium]|nr:2-oxoacid:ferredoxin oxidoreductase subunit beta [Acidobacteriota bacterium]
MSPKSVDYANLLRTQYIPHIWCPGCGHGIILKAVLRAVERLGLDKNKIAFVSGIGCSSRAVGYVDFNTLHTTHGRALAFATGVKIARPDLHVIVVSGDGDALAIGGNHFIHACRRNIDMTLIVFNNYIYGMTGGQYSPTTPEGSFASTAPFGSVEPPFDVCNLAIAAGATYVARGTAYSTAQLDKYVEKGIQNPGFSVIEALSQCPTYYGRKNKLRTPVDNLKWQKDVVVSAAKAKDMTPDQLAGKIQVGELHHGTRPEFTRTYQTIIQRAKDAALAE